MSYRDEQSFREEYIGERFHRIRSMISRREIDPTQSNGDHVLALGRQAEDGSFEQDNMDVLGSCGIIARPADDSVVETITLFVGSDANHPVAVGQLDHTRRYVIADVKLDADETIVYTSKTIVKILKDGTVEIRNIDGTAVPLATKADVERLRDEFLGHLHLTPQGPSEGPLKNDGATPIVDIRIDGTSVLRSQ